MPKPSLNTKGFGVTGVFVIVVAIAVVAGGGAYVYHQDHKIKTTRSTTTSHTSTSDKKSTTDPYAVWNSYTTKYDKLSFKYPAGWSISDTSSTNDTDITPGQDAITLTSSDGLQVVIGTGGTEFDGGNPGVKVLSASPINLLGGSHYLVFTSAGSDSTTGGAVVTTTNALPSLSNLPTSKNIRLSSSAASGLPTPVSIINVQYSATTGSDVHYAVSKFQQDPNYATALKILESISY